VREESRLDLVEVGRAGFFNRPILVEQINGQFLGRGNSSRPTEDEEELEERRRSEFHRRRDVRSKEKGVLAVQNVRFDPNRFVMNANYAVVVRELPRSL
jgi:hypothetical protein